MKKKSLSSIMFTGVVALCALLSGCGVEDGDSEGDRDAKEMSTVPAEISELASTSPAGSLQVFWVSQPVHPGEAVVVTGSGFDSSTKVQVHRLPDDGSAWNGLSGWQDTTLFQQTNRSLKFLLPEGEDDGVFAFQIIKNAGTSHYWLVNAPSLWFVQGDRGSSATPGGWLRMFGTSLAIGDATKAQLKLVSVEDSSAVTTINASSGDSYSVQFAIPTTLATGSYKAHVNNGHGGSLAWRQLDTYDAKTVSIQAAPAIGPNSINLPSESAENVIQEKLDYLRDHGGGTLHLAAGFYVLTKNLTIHSNSILAGSTSGATALHWPLATFPSNTIHGGLIVGEGGFGLQDVTLSPSDFYVGPAVQQIGSDSFSYIRRVTINMKKTEAHRGAIFIVDHKNFEMSGCTINGSTTVIRTVNSQNVRITGNNFHYYGGMGVYAVTGKNFIVENNTMTINRTPQQTAASSSLGLAYATYGGAFAKNLYFGHNTLGSDQNGDNGFTFDGGDGLYFGYVASTSGKTVTLNDVPALWDSKKKVMTPVQWIGAALYIVDGRGAGQYRYVTGYNDKTVTVDHNWFVAPDSTSVVSLVNMLGRALFIGNDIKSTAYAEANFFSSDVVFAENTIANHTNSNGRFGAEGGSHNSGLQPAWHFQALDNKIDSGKVISLFYSSLRRPVRNSDTGLDHSWYKGPLVAAGVIRGTTTHSASTTSMIGLSEISDTVVESNVIPSIEYKGNRDYYGIRNTILRNNTWGSGAAPISASGYRFGVIVDPPTDP